MTIHAGDDESHGLARGHNPFVKGYMKAQNVTKSLQHLLRSTKKCLVCCGCDTSYIVSVHIQCQASIYTLSLCHGHSWRVRLAKQETLVSPLVCRGPRMSTLVLYCWCHSESTSVLLYFTLMLTIKSFDNKCDEMTECPKAKSRNYQGIFGVKYRKN